MPRPTKSWWSKSPVSQMDSARPIRPKKLFAKFLIQFGAYQADGRGCEVLHE